MSMMNNQDNLIDDDYKEQQEEEEKKVITSANQGETYPISDNESTTDSTSLINTNIMKNEDQDTMSQDSLINDDDEQNDHNNKNDINDPLQQISSIISTVNSRMTIGARSVNLDEHIKFVKQKKEEADELRLQRFQEQLRKKEQKWQQQQLDRVRKWLQLRNRDTDHRLQVEERRKKREEEAKAKIDEILRREKEREQRTNSQTTGNLRGNASHKSDSLMSLSTDVLLTRRAISAPRIRSKPTYNMTNRRRSNDSPITTSSEETADNAATHEESSNIVTTGAGSTNTTVTTNGDHQRRGQSINRQHLDETIRRLSKPKNINMVQSVHVATTASSSTNGLPSSHSSHQIRLATPLITPTNNHSASSRASSSTRKHISSRPVTAPAHPVSSVTDSGTSETDDSTVRQPSNRTGSQAKLPLPPSSKPPTSLTSSSSRSKPPVPRSVMTTSHSSSTLSSVTTTNTSKQNVRRVNGKSPSKPKTEIEPSSSASSPTEQNSQADLIPSEQISDEQVLPKENITSTNGDTSVKSDEDNEQTLIEIESSTPSILPITNNTVVEINNPPTVSLTKKEQQNLDEQEYQRKLSQKIREAQQRMELERQREEERKRQLEFEEYEREQEQIRIAEEQRRVEQERLQRAIEERERENELKRQEEQRLQQQREELERKQAEEAERLQRERQERAKKEEEERNERKKRLDLIMRRTRQVSPTPKPDICISKTNIDETNDQDQLQSTISHSISDNRIPTSVSTDNFLSSTTNNNELITSETPKFKSPLIQSLLNKARNTRSTDNLAQSTMTTSQLMTESMIDTNQSTLVRTDLSDNDDGDDDGTEQHDSDINNTVNGHSDSPLSASPNLNSYHEHSIETATTAAQ
ncbi:hypothetical protein I4U23_029114 [Adineta vaga]|nr:hypothetical protein I4U23_029114 [Adineta vaga]